MLLSTNILEPVQVLSYPLQMSQVWGDRARLALFCQSLPFFYWQPAQLSPRYEFARLTTRSALQCVMEVVAALSTPLLQCCQY